MSFTDLATLHRSRHGLHAVAEHVMAAARYQRDGHISLVAWPGGIATPRLDTPAGPWQVRVEGTDLVVEDGDDLRRAPLTTLAAAGELVGIAPGAPAQVYTPATPLEPHAPLGCDPAATAYVASWYALVDEALGRLGGDGVAKLWPEHFDLAATIDEINYGGSPGDAAHDEPYLYVGPWSPPPPDGRFWNEPFGASRDSSRVRSADDALAFYREGLDQMRSSSPPSNSGRTP